MVLRAEAQRPRPTGESREEIGPVTSLISHHTTGAQGSCGSLRTMLGLHHSTGPSGTCSLETSAQGEGSLKKKLVQ